MKSKTPNPFDDFARAVSGATRAFADIRTEVEVFVRQRMERLLADMDLVPRDEFEAVKAMAAKARSEQEALEKRVAELEKVPAAKAKPASRRKTAS